MYSTDAEKWDARMRSVRDAYLAIGEFTQMLRDGELKEQGWEDCTWQTLQRLLTDGMHIEQGIETIVDEQNRERVERRQRELLAAEAQYHRDLDRQAEQEAFADAWHAQYDDDPNPFHGNYSEE